jgi:hypothetical protein
MQLFSGNHDGRSNLLLSIITFSATSAFAEIVELFLAFAWDDDLGAGQAMLGAVLGSDGFAFGGWGQKAALGSIFKRRRS